MHWHGLASPPDMDGHPSDVIAPGQSREIAFPIVDGAGTYWYHLHPDGRTARQVLGRHGRLLSWPGETVTLAIRFEQYAGLHVLHCHNLEHEDAGMMPNLEVS